MNKKVILVRRPKGLPVDSDFLIVTEPIPTSLSQGEVLVRVEWTSIDPAQRIWISSYKGYFPSVPLGEVVRAYSIGVIVTSTVGSFKPGSYVSGLFGWQEYCKIDHRRVFKLPSQQDPHIYLGVLGLTGLSAYVAVVEIARPLGKEVMVISSAAGSVGSVACQLAKMRGCTVIGITGSDEKCEWLLKELRIDAAINYKSENFAQRLEEACPKGIDIFIDSVGGVVLDAVLLNIKKYARIVMCGAISTYCFKKKAPIHYYPLVISNSATMIGFIVNDYKDHFVIALKSLSKWIEEGKIKYREQILHGLENGPRGLAMLFTGENQGKLILDIEKQIEKI